MSELEKLNLPDAALGLDGWSSEYVKVGNDYKHFRVTGFSDTDTVLNIIWSNDGINDGFCSTVTLKSGKWKTEKIEVMLPYVKYNVLGSTENNTRTIINTLGRTFEVNNTGTIGRSTGSMCQLNEENADTVELKEKETKRGKSPFRRFSISRKNSMGKIDKQIDITSNHDPRIPDGIYRNSILIGAAPGQLTTLPPPPTDGLKYVLTYNSGTYIWEQTQNWEL